MQFPKNGRALVTGSTGFIGARLVERLLDRGMGISVTSLVRSPKPIASRRETETVVGDLTNKSSLKFSGPFDVVYHLASLTPRERNKEKLRRVNYEGTRNLFESVIDKTKFFVYVSGLAAFSPERKEGEELAVDETSPKNTDLEFVRIRLEAEQFLRNACKDAGIDFTVIYFPDIVYGNGGYFKSLFLEPLRDGKFRIPGSGEYIKNYIHRDDAVAILIMIAEKNAINESYVATDSRPAPFVEFVNFIADQFGRKRPGSAPLMLAKLAVGTELIEMLTTSMKASNRKISQLYEFRYPTYVEGIPEVVSSFKNES